MIFLFNKQHHTLSTSSNKSLAYTLSFTIDFTVTVSTNVVCTSDTYAIGSKGGKSKSQNIRLNFQENPKTKILFDFFSSLSSSLTNTISSSS
jgi:hypothetical protein